MRTQRFLIGSSSLILAVVLPLTDGFLPQRLLHRSTVVRPTHLYALDDDEDAVWMASLQHRIDQTHDQPIPILICPFAVLPRQEVRIHLDAAVLLHRIQDRLAAGEPYVGLVGTIPPTTTNNDTESGGGAMRWGTQAKIIKTAVLNGTIVLDVRGTDTCFQVRDLVPIAQSVKESLTLLERGWFEASVESLDRLPYMEEISSLKETKRNGRRRRKRKEREMQHLVQVVDCLTMSWINLLYKLQPDKILHRLATIGPVPEHPNQRTMWIGALLNDEKVAAEDLEAGHAPLSMRLLLATSIEGRLTILLDWLQRRKHLRSMIFNKQLGLASLCSCFQRSTILTDPRFLANGILQHHFETGATFTQRYPGTFRYRVRRQLRREVTSWRGLGRGVFLAALHATGRVRARALTGIALAWLVLLTDVIPGVRVVPPPGMFAERTWSSVKKKRQLQRTADSITDSTTEPDDNRGNGSELEVLGEFE